MNCPRCEHDLRRTRYEGFPACRCDKCFGYLLKAARIDSIKRNPQKSVEELKTEVSNELGEESEAKAKCPRCRRAMTEELHRGLASYQVSLCKTCELVWFDGGELALLQLNYAASIQGKDAAEFRRRLQEMTPEALAKFEKNVGKMRHGPSSIFGEAFVGLLKSSRRRRHLFDDSFDTW